MDKRPSRAERLRQQFREKIDALHERGSIDRSEKEFLLRVHRSMVSTGTLNSTLGAQLIECLKKRRAESDV